MKIKILLIYLMMMLSVGFYMLLERKILGYFNWRKGPNKFIFIGFIQFLADLLKLIFKENLVLMVYNKMIYNFFIFLLMMMSFMIWVFFPLFLNLFNLKFFLLLMLLVLMNKILIFINLIWETNSIYSIISIVRLIIQNFSYEILFMLIIFLIIFMYKDYNMIKMLMNFFFSNLFIFSFMIFYFWLLSILVELNRLPFDYFEGESELVSGFNIEFSSFYFMILFLVEYLDMIFMSLLSLFLFFNLNFFFFSNYLYLILFLFLFLFIRGFLIRYRIDKMFIILWKVIFPLFFNYLMMMFLFILF